tara:strand:- start:495 stop:1790 length:1296 start_codon:yes stop_codon:yes gene_type:complete
VALSLSSPALAPLQVRDFRLLLVGFAIGQMLMPLQFFTQILWVQENAPHDIWLILVALIGASRGVGSLLFGLYGGALADRFDRRKLLITTQLLLVISTLTIGGLMLTGIKGPLGFGLFYLLTFLAAGLQAIDAPTRLAIVPDVLGPDRVSAGMALNQAAGQLAMPTALLGMGFMVTTMGYGGAYIFSAVGHLTAIVCLALMHYLPEASQHHAGYTPYRFGKALSDVREGVRYARSHSEVLWIILLLVAMMALGFPATANLGPTWITTVIGVSVANVGFVAMTWGLGAFFGAVLMARLSSFEKRGRLIAFGATLFAVSFVIFVAQPTVLFAVVGNFGLGAGMTITMVSSTVLIQQVVPNAVRGRIMSLVQLNMGFAQLMTLPVATIGQWLPLTTLFPSMALLTLAVIAAILIFKSEVRRAVIIQPARLEPGG